MRECCWRSLTPLDRLLSKASTSANLHFLTGSCLDDAQAVTSRLQALNSLLLLWRCCAVVDSSFCFQWTLNCNTSPIRTHKQGSTATIACTPVTAPIFVVWLRLWVSSNATEEVLCCHCEALSKHPLWCFPAVHGKSFVAQISERAYPSYYVGYKRTGMDCLHAEVVES